MAWCLSERVLWDPISVSIIDKIWNCESPVSRVVICFIWAFNENYNKESMFLIVKKRSRKFFITPKISSLWAELSIFIVYIFYSTRKLRQINRRKWRHREFVDYKVEKNQQLLSELLIVSNRYVSAIIHISFDIKSYFTILCLIYPYFKSRYTSL